MLVRPMMILEIPMFEIYYGEDDYSRKRAMIHDALRARLGDPEMASLNSVTVSAADSSVPPEVVAQAGAVPFLANGRLVIVTMKVFWPCSLVRRAVEIWIWAGRRTWALTTGRPR